MRWRCRDLAFDFDDARVLVMGVVNVTPDSFSDGGRYLDPDAAIAHGRRLLAEGADLLDVGAESTRPGSQPVPAAEQIRRLRPVLKGLRADGDPCLSVDTASAEVAREALAMGARVVNDVTAFDDPEMAGVVANAGAGAVLMHMRGRPATMQDDPRYADVVAEVRGFLADRVARARAAGIAEEAIAVDPGIGFGKAVAHTLQLIARLGDIVSLGRPVVLGASRKSFIGRVLGLEVDQRLEGSLAASAIGAFLGARVLRVHDVQATSRAARLAAAVRAAGPAG